MQNYTQKYYSESSESSMLDTGYTNFIGMTKKAILEFFNEALADWKIAKFPTLIIMAIDFMGFLEKMLHAIKFDYEFTYFLFLICVLDTIGGAGNAIKRGEFSLKKMCMGVLDKIWKYGRAIAMVGILKYFTVNGSPNTVFEKVDFVVFVIIMSIEGNSVCKQIFGYDLIEGSKKAWAFVAKVKPPEQP